MTDRPPTCSIVVPLYNEQEGIRSFHRSLGEVVRGIPYRTEILYVDSDSPDATPALLREIAAETPGVVVLSLCRNFGHQAALSAGLAHAAGDVVITMDGDGEHPPGLIPRMLERYEQGCDVVLAQRKNPKAGFVNSLTARIFYRLLGLISETEIPPGTGDFRLMSRYVVDCLNRMPERHRFLRGMVLWPGFRTEMIPYETAARLGGKSKYTFRRQMRLAGAGLFSFSTAPLTLALYAGCGVLGLGLMEVLYVVWTILAKGSSNLPPGWTSLMLALLMIGGIQLLMLGLQGYYIGMLFQEIKGRPIYILRPPPPPGRTPVDGKATGPETPATPRP